MTPSSQPLLSLLARRNQRLSRTMRERAAELRQIRESLARETKARSDAERRLAEALQEKELLQREVHHRVKNNLQVLSSLLRLQAPHLTDEVALRTIQEMRNRIHSMALVYEKLQASDDPTGIDFGDYLRKLVRYQLRSHRAKPANLNLELELEPVPINLDTAVPCGLIVTELLDNAFKHAFPGQHQAGQPRPSIVIGARAGEDERIVLSIADNGVGLPDSIRLESANNLGLQIVNVLSEQLGARVTIQRSQGTQFTLVFQELRYAERV